MDNNDIEVKGNAVLKPRESKRLKTLVLILAFALTAVITSMITFALTVRYLFTPSVDDWKSKADVLKQYIDEYAYYEPDESAMQDAALKAYVYASGDPYSEYYNEKEFDELYEENYGRYVGIGVTVSLTEISYNGENLSLYKIVRISDGSPAQEAGLLVGDFMFSLRENGEEIFSRDVGADNFSYMIKGVEGTLVDFSVLRENSDTYEKIDFVVERRAVVVDSVSWEISQNAPDIGVISMYQFDMNTPVMLENAFDYFLENGIEKAVIDLRGNGGGDLFSVYACACYFVNEGDVIVSAEDNLGYVEVLTAQPITYSYEYSSCNVSSRDIGKYRNFKLVVLVDEYTASAAELLTAVLRDYNLATIVGENTYGKGTMQTIFPLESSGMSGGIKITTNVYFPPCGENYDGVGIAPDIAVKYDENQEDNRLDVAIKLLG